MDDELLVSDSEVRRPLFSSPRPENDSNATERDERGRNEGHRNKEGNTMRRRTGFGWSILTVMLFLVLCALGLNIVLNFNGNWRDITWNEIHEGATQFFSNEPLGTNQRTHTLFGCFGALPLAIAISACIGVFTCYFMYYDSNIPGDFPPTPVSPRKGADPSPTSEQRWHLGYMFVLVNGLVAFILALFYLRQYMGLLPPLLVSY